MKKLLFILCLALSLAATAQPPTSTYTPISTTGYNWLRGFFRALHLPAASGAPGFTTGQWHGAGAIYLDSAADVLWYWSSGSWHSLASASTPGWDDVLSVNQALTVNHTIDVDSNDLYFEKVGNFDIATAHPSVSGLGAHFAMTGSNTTMSAFDNTTVSSVAVSRLQIHLTPDPTGKVRIDNIGSLAAGSTVGVLALDALNDVYYVPTSSLATTAAAVFTETVERFTGSTSSSVTVAHTPLTTKARMVFFNGVEMDPSNVSITGTGFTLSGVTRESSDIVTVKYSY